MRRSRKILTLLGAAALAAAGLAIAAAGAGPGGDTPPLADRPEPRGEACLTDPETMRREHMHQLEAHRHEAVREGRREPERSLAACVDCHAAEQARNGVGAGEAPAFCASCHDYAGVQAGCFQCHSNERRAR